MRVLKELQAAAPSLQIQLHIMDVRVADDLEKAFETAANARVGALTLTPVRPAFSTRTNNEYLHLP